MFLCAEICANANIMLICSALPFASAPAGSSAPLVPAWENFGRVLDSAEQRLPRRSVRAYCLAAIEAQRLQRATGMGFLEQRRRLGGVEHPGAAAYPNEVGLASRSWNLMRSNVPSPLKEARWRMDRDSSTVACRDWTPWLLSSCECALGGFMEVCGVVVCNPLNPTCKLYLRSVGPTRRMHLC